MCHICRAITSMQMSRTPCQWQLVPCVYVNRQYFRLVSHNQTLASRSIIIIRIILTLVNVSQLFSIGPTQIKYYIWPYHIYKSTYNNRIYMWAYMYTFLKHVFLYSLQTQNINCLEYMQVNKSIGK